MILWAEIEKFLSKNQNCFRRNRSTTLQILTVRQIIEGVRAKKSWGNIADFSNAFDSIHSGKMEQILITYSLPKETVTAIIKTRKQWFAHLMETYILDIVVGDLQEDTLVPNLFIIYLNYVLRTSIDPIKENSFTLKEARSRWYHAETITRRLHRWSSASFKYTCSSWISTA